MKPIKGFEDYYAVTEKGEVFSLTREITFKSGGSYIKKGKILIPHINSQTGYYMVSLWKNNKGHTKSVHRLVAIAYLPNPENKLEINHKDSNRTNPNVENLEWATRSENVIHGYKYGYASQKPRRNLTEDDYLVIFTRFLKGEPFAAIISSYNISPGRLSMNLRELVKKWDREIEYNNERFRQRSNRGGAHAN